jgi:uncharacterized membrane protein YphA (DoxX/SURF4 family)
MESYKIAPLWLEIWMAQALPWLELYPGLLLAAGLFTRFCAAWLGLLLLGFEALLAQAWLRHLPLISCGCFGAGGSSSLVREFAQNIPLLVLAVLAFRFGRGYSIDSVVDNSK